MPDLFRHPALGALSVGNFAQRRTPELVRSDVKVIGRPPSPIRDPQPRAWHGAGMSGPAPTDPERPVLPWRLVAGALLHVAVPAYLIVLAAAWLMMGPAGAPLGFVARVSGLFVAGFAGLILLAAVLAALADPPLRRVRSRRERRDPATVARAAAEHVSQALRRAASIGGTASAIGRLREARWDFADDRDRAIAADLSRAVAAFATAHASAAPDRRETIAIRATEALGRIAAAVEDLAAERARLDEGVALTHAAYLGQRYPAPFLDPTGPDHD